MKPLVFCIDDDATAILIYKRVIEKANYASEVITATNGQQALDYYEQLISHSRQESPLYPKVVFLDLAMPIMEGWEFLEVFNSKYYFLFPDTRVIVVSSAINPDEVERVLQYNFVLDFIPKPLTSQILHDLLLHI